MARVGLQFWRDHRRGAQVSTGVSLMTHAIVISAWVYVTLPGVLPKDTSSATHVWYLPPPDPKPAIASSAEAIRYVELAPVGEGAGFGVESRGFELDVGGARSGATVGDAGRDSVTSVAQEGMAGEDSVFTIIEVDSAAARLPESAAPKYPAELLLKRVEGQAIVQFIVDTTGFADPGSFNVVLSSHPDFARSVREALPGMRFSTARIGSVKVRQLVELPFIFNIADPPPVPAESATVRATARRRP